MSRFLVNPIERHNNIVNRLCESREADHLPVTPTIRLTAHVLTAVTMPIFLVMPTKSIRKLADNLAAKNK